MIKIMTEDKNLTLKLPKEESDKLFSQLALILLGHNKDSESTSKNEPMLLGIHKLNPPKLNPPKFKPPKVEIPKQDEVSYKGFLYIKCKHCGAVKGFCSKHPLDHYKCDSCGGKTEFSDERMVRMKIDCMNCGSHFDYYTNITDDMILYDCIKCQSPIDLVFNERRNQFNTLGKS